MASFWSSSFLSDSKDRVNKPVGESRCPDLLAFLAIAFEAPHDSGRGLHPVLTNRSPEFSDVSMGGISFDVRKTKTSALPRGIAPEILNGRDFVVVKHPRASLETVGDEEILSEIATELQVLRHKPLLEHPHIIGFLAIMYHNAGDAEAPHILPALVLEYAELGNLQSYQADGHGRKVSDKLTICIDAAEGLKALHDAGIVHGDVKASNLLVCRHPSREFIVKISDLGFALSVREREPRLVGNTKYLDAPEASEPLDPSYLPQLDIYSYGLLLYTVFKNGAVFYEAVEAEHRDTMVPLLKSTGMLAVTTQLNLLHSMQNERCLLFLVCKVLAYSLHPDPRNRYRNMVPIIGQLTMANSEFSFDVPGHDSSFLSQPQLFQSSHFSEQQRHLTTWLPHLINAYCLSLRDLLPEGATPLVHSLKSSFLQRAESEIELFFGCHRPEPGATHCNISTADYLALLRDTLGLLPYDAKIVKLAPVYPVDEGGEPSKDSLLLFSTNTMPDFSKIDKVLVKLPTEVQMAISQALLEISSTWPDQVRRRLAYYNLAFAFTDGIGVGVDVVKSQEMLITAARLELTAAKQTLVMRSCGERPSNVQDDEWREWLGSSAKDGLPHYLGFHENAGESSYVACRRLLKLKRVYRNPDVLSTDAGGSQLWDGPDCLNWINWEKIFLHLGAAAGLTTLVESMLERRPDLLDQQDLQGQTPLLLACQSGNVATVQFLISQGANCRQADTNGITPLHWAMTLDGQGQKATIQTLMEKGAEINAWARSRWTAGSLAMGGTPLKWAVAFSDLCAVLALLENGADPTYRPFGKEAWTAFEDACYYHEAQILERFLLDPKVLAVVNEQRPLVDSETSPTVQSLWFALAGGSRWSRMNRHGEAYVQRGEETIRILTEKGASCDCVLQIDSNSRMSATFATAWHGCNADIMRSGLRFGFKDSLESTFGTASSGGTSLFFAITDRHHEMFTILLENGANVNARDMHGYAPMHRAAKENDDVFFVEKLAEFGAPIDPQEPHLVAPFYTATYCGNLRIAKYLWDHGANRDETNNPESGSILAKLIWIRTRNAAERIKFILSLPDRDGSDGFVVLKSSDHHSSAFHFAVAVFTEDPDQAEITRNVISLLLAKYHEPNYLNSTIGPHHDTCLGMAVEVGNYKVMQLLLEAGADPNIQDEYGRTPLDKAYWRYCYPSLTEALRSVDLDDKLQVKKTLDFVNRNTSEILILLTKTYNAKANVFQFPAWHAGDPGYRDLAWVLERLKENSAREAQAVPDDKPIWGGLPITIPERPMQFTSKFLASNATKVEAAKPLGEM